MKKYLSLLLALLLLLAGCANEEGEPTETTVPVETMPAGYYVENSQLESVTAGAVRQYALPGAEYKWIKCVGDRVLLAENSDPAQLCLLAEENGVPVATFEIMEFSDNSEAVFNGYAYYDQVTHSVIYLDPQLKQTQSISLAADATNPIISRDGNQIFYRVGNEIRAIDVARNISRLVKTQNSEKQNLVGTCFDGKLLICETENAEGNVDTQYISTENGQTLVVDNTIQTLFTYEDHYLLERMDGMVLQRITGTLNGEARQLNVDDACLVSALEIGGAVGYSSTENGLVLNYYDLASGKKTASVSLPGFSDPQSVIADRWSGCVWILAADPSGSGSVLLRWNIKSATTPEEKSYVGTLFTVENPDIDSINAFSDRISALDKKHGVRIRVWKDAVSSPANHVLVPEHQPVAIAHMLDQLESVLAEFPKSFISKSISSKVRICLVRSIDGETKGVQYWSGKYAFIALSTGADVRTEFLKAFGSVIDSHVLGNSPKYDYWNTLNPTGFLYGGAVDDTLAAGENRSFVDVESMQSGTVDRSRVFWQAMMPENAEMFSGETMQKKLTMLCKAIRDAWNLEKSKDTYPWEQYLEKSIAYKKK